MRRLQSRVHRTWKVCHKAVDRGEGFDFNISGWKPVAEIIFVIGKTRNVESRIFVITGTINSKFWNLGIRLITTVKCVVDFGH